jgi:hypothetical protein
MGQRVVSAFQAQFVPQCVNLCRLRFNPVGCGKPHRVNIAGGPLCQSDCFFLDFLGPAPFCKTGISCGRQLARLLLKRI